MKTNIFIEVSTSSPARMKRGYGYVMECAGKTREAFGEIEATYHEAVLKIICEALSRYHKKSEITIHNPDAYIANMANHRLQDWEKNNFVSAKEKEVANAAEWREYARFSKMHEIRIKTEHHEYSEWIKNEIRRRGNV